MFLSTSLFLHQGKPGHRTHSCLGAFSDVTSKGRAGLQSTQQGLKDEGRGRVSTVTVCLLAPYHIHMLHTIISSGSHKLPELLLLLLQHHSTLHLFHFYLCAVVLLLLYMFASCCCISSRTCCVSCLYSATSCVVWTFASLKWMLRHSFCCCFTPGTRRDTILVLYVL